MDLTKLTLPVVLAAAIIGIYVALKPSQPVGAVTPNPASGGVPGPYSSQGVVQPVTYNVPPVSLAPNPFIMLSDPLNPSPGINNPLAPGNRAGGPPQYLAFNFGPSHDLTKKATPKPIKESECGGCCGDCSGGSGCAKNKNSYPDGSGNTPLASSGSRLLRNSNPQDYLDFAMNNVDSFLQTLPDFDTIPSLTSYLQSGMLN